MQETVTPAPVSEAQTEEQVMPVLITQLRALEANVAAQEAALRAEKAAFEAEMAPRVAQLEEAKAASRAIRDQLTCLSLANHAAGAPKRFGGVTLNETKKVVVHDQAAAIAALDGQRSSKGKEVVKRSLDPLALRDVALRSTEAIPGIEVFTDYHVALDPVADSNQV